MRENFVQSMAKQVEAQTHEESKFWRALQPLPNQSNMQGRESKKKSKIQQFRMAMRNAKRSTRCRTKSKNVKNEYCTLCEISQALRNQRLRKMNFAQALRKSSSIIFKYFCTDSVRFLSRDILCNYLFFPCNHMKIFLDIQDI